MESDEGKGMYEVTLNGRVEWTGKAFDADDALNEFADYLERRDVPAFWNQDSEGRNCIAAAGDTYYARPRGA